MDIYDELLEQSATCDGCGCAVCQCHRLQSITWASDGRPYGAHFYPVQEDKPVVEEKPVEWRYIVVTSVGWGGLLAIVLHSLL